MFIRVGSLVWYRLQGVEEVAAFSGSRIDVGIDLGDDLVGLGSRSCSPFR